MAIAISPERRDIVRAIWPEVLRRIADGEFLVDVAEAVGVPEHEIKAYRMLVHGAQAEYAQAREDSGDAFMVKALREADKDVGKEFATHVKTRIDTYKWAARIRNPRVYSDKSSIDLNVKTVDLTRIISDANARLAAARLIGQGSTSGITDASSAHAPAHDTLPLIASLL
jgi:hypothetical protein